MPVKLSVVVITYNEERNIARCLESVKQVADELVVVDSYSTDRTREICLSYGARFMEHPFEGHIEQKNYALTQATFQHVLSLDADEALSPELEQAVLAAKNNWQSDAYSMNRLTNYCGKWIHHSGWYPDTKVRLFDRSKAVWGGENPHDKIILSQGATLQHLRGDLLHYSYYTVTQHLGQINKFTDASSKALIRDGKTVSLPMVILKPLFRFFRAYILKRGFLDGPEGFIISVSSAESVYYKYLKLYMHNRQQKRREV
ncbi:glycosyltransferase family 2 protein [Pontibacter chinhatensis]|uniref:Glycosyltransferase involved in cell wall bisynthesis n=1 Tax=Pontibacter chinhatensis TaxID=1436961 RepID=A0A1I2VRI8_9BACT|nr:glycosyltransferase family 2 protein [Pontibacter chinhatensis]SFG91955.1 Glycosyltransferase involved in cell wall bisynthesis [Pontibacter chinhatensis]